VGRIIADDENANGWGLSFNDDGGNTLHFYSNNPSFSVDSTLALTLNQWYFVAAIQTTIQGYQYLFLFIFDASGNLLGNTGNATASAFGASTGANYSIGGDITGSATGGTHRFAGTIDEVTLYASGLSYNQVQPLSAVTHACSGIVPNHYSVSAASPIVNCTPASVSVIAHNSAHTPIATADTMALSTSTGHGDWTLTTGSGNFTAGSSNSGAASYTYAQSDNGSAVFALRDTYAETVTIGVSDGGVTAQSGTARANEDSPLTFVASGFRITNGGNVAATIGTQVAGVASSQSLALQAVRTDTNTGACTNVFPSGTSVNVSLAFQCNNPATCVSGQTLSVSNNGASTSIAANPASGISSYTSVPLKFTTANAEAPISLNYSDVGQITLAAKYTLPLGSGALSGTSLTGAAQFVVEPYSFNLSSIKTTASGMANPAASAATGPVFIAAGQSFSATVTAVNAVGNATPNFGQELSPATVSLAPGLVLPTTGNLPAVSGSFGTFSAGVASGTRFSWPEVGIMSLTPSTSNYLSTGNTITGASSGNVGRFIPNSFSYALNTPSFLAACPATNAGFTYVGQPFNYSVAPVITVTALALGGTTTQNYAGSFFKLTNASLTGRSYTPTPSSPGLTLTGLPATTADPVIASSGGGIGTLTFSSGTGISFTRGSAIAPFNANIALSINVIDTDGVVAANPVTFGASAGIAFTTATGSQQYYGRLALNDAVGSELLDLPMTLTTQYYVGTAAGFATNTQDTCTTHPAIALSNYQLNLTSTCVRDSGSPGLSGVGCTTAASTSSAYRTTPVSGNFNLNLAAPGSGYAGAVTVTATAPTWLQYPWNASSCGASNSNPCGLATFGVFPGPASRIYQREVY
jgi:MSHA biogenesis protein MshQ